IVGEYVVAFLLKNPVSKRNGVFCFYMIFKKAVPLLDNSFSPVESRVSDGSGILLRDTQNFFFTVPFSRKRYSGQHGPKGNAVSICSLEPISVKL
ncbi:hypothetical protein, partial [Flavobacterium sp. HBTb2-11-1]|uniref:hypothetical protein n=1 Tax=Flavobacterium sp. HBTb2-11-1 TaxID=2692212 RepID=UPI001F1AF83E